MVLIASFILGYLVLAAGTSLWSRSLSTSTNWILFIILAIFFKFRTIIEIGKSFLKFSLVFIFVLYFFSGHFRDFINLSSLQLNAAVLAGYDLVFSFVWALFITLIFIVAADMAHQYADFMSRNKMSFQELKDENKEAEVALKQTQTAFGATCLLNSAWAPLFPSLCDHHQPFPLCRCPALRRWQG